MPVNKGFHGPEGFFQKFLGGKMEVAIMKCGCRAMGHDAKTGKPICLSRLCDKEMFQVPDFSSRKSACLYCKKEVASKKYLPFFVYQSDKERDSHYCGCMGWE